MRIDCIVSDIDNERCATRWRRLLQKSAFDEPLDSATELMEKVVAEEQGFDWSTAAMGAGVGFVAGYAIMKAFRRNKHEKHDKLVEPLL